MNLKKFKVTSFKTTKDLVSYLDDLQHSMPAAIFRGHSDSSWPLTPSAWRPGGIVESKQKEYLKGFESALTYMLPTHVHEQWRARKEFAPEIWDEKLNNLIAWLCAEQQVVEDFCSLCDSVALPVPGYDAPFPARLFEGSGNESVPVRNYGSEFAFAQHFGIPTRFLDFTENSLKALYFAAAGVRAEGLLEIPRPQFSVIAASPDLIDLGEYVGADGQSVRAKRVLRSEIPRLHAQDGLFLLCNERANSWYLQNDSWPSFDQITKNWKFEMITAPPEISEEVLVRLKRNGIDEVRMKPSYETAAAEVRRQRSISFRFFG